MSDSYIAVSPGLLTLQALMKGDISYAQGFTYGWDQYWENVEPLYTQIPLATTIGCAIGLLRDV